MNLPDHILFTLLISAAVFFAGAWGFLMRRNAIGMLISLELMLNSVNLSFVSVNSLLYPQNSEGLFSGLFIITVAAAEAAVAIAIILSLYRRLKSAEPGKANEMKY